MRKVPRGRRSMATLFALIMAVVSFGGVYAFADTYITSYNDTVQDPSYGPYAGSLYASNFISSSQIIQAENWGMKWSYSNAANVRNNWDHLGPVFHVFDYGTSNCALPFNFDGAWVSNMPSPWVYYKNATCGGTYSGYNNEARVYMDASNVAGETSYYGGAEFRLDDGSLYWPSTGKVSNDIYLNGALPWQEQKDNLPTWCFQGNGSTYAC